LQKNLCPDDKILRKMSKIVTIIVSCKKEKVEQYKLR
jgi:hypothetical protein